MYIAILIVHLIVSLILIGVILLQAGRGGGLADIGGGASGSLGTRASTYLTKATTVCAVIFICTSIGLAALSAHQGRSLMQRARVKPAATPEKTEAAPADGAKKTDAPVEETSAASVETSPETPVTTKTPAPAQ